MIDFHRLSMPAFHVLTFSHENADITQESVLNKARNDRQINESCGCPKRAELSDVNINTGAQSSNTETASSTGKKKKCFRAEVYILT